MTPAVASAPGKVVVAGEYAVLDGAPAIAMAVNRRAFVNIKPTTEPTHTLRTFGYRDGRWRFDVSAAGTTWVDALPEADAMRLIEVVIAETGWCPDDRAEITVDSRALHDSASGQKLGLGSSAAVAVSLAAACRESTNTPVPLSDSGGRAHYRFQNNRGSGVDIATAWSGGLLRFVKGAAPTRLAWPDGLEQRLYWSGTPASTGAKIAGAPDTAAGSLRDAAHAVAEAWAQGDSTIILKEMAAFTDALEAFDASTGTGVFAAGHAALSAAGRGIPGLVYKPCGAGGGDIGMAIATDAALLRRFDTVVAASGYTVLDASLDPLGVEVVAEAP